MTSDFDEVLKPCRGYERNARAAPLKQCVGPYRGAVNHFQISRRECVRSGQLPDTVEDRLGGVLLSREDFGNS